MVAKSCGTCMFWKVPANNFGKENRSLGTWGECSKAPLNNPKDGVFMLVQLRPESLGNAHLRTRVEFYCAHYETITKEMKGSTGQIKTLF